MSKKKASSSSTMTLKDFHGGSIPSDLALPSAPGATFRSSDRFGIERHGPWGNAISRSEHRLRPGSSPSAKGLDEKSPFLSPIGRIGRHFDEDERTPLNSYPVPRRTISDESIYAQPSPKTDKHPTRTIQSNNFGIHSASSAFLNSTTATDTISTAKNNSSSSNPSAFSGISVDGTQNYMNSSHFSPSSHSSSPTVSLSICTEQNVWKARKNAGGTKQMLTLTSSVDSAAAKLAHASALEKVSSGMWESRQSLLSADHGANHHVRMPNNDQVKEGNLCSIDDPLKSANINPSMVTAAALAASVETGMKIQCGAKECSGGLPLERPKLKLLPRTRPIEASEPSPVTQQHKQSHMGTFMESHLKGTPETQSEVLPETVTVSAGRPKLSLKPRSYFFEGRIGGERSVLFGGGRPRELVLKERGMSDGPVESLPAINRERMRKDPVTGGGRSDERSFGSSVDSQCRPSGKQVQYGKATSSIELALAFSRHAPDSDGVDPSGGVPFSRLAGFTARPQINSY